jgi:adenylosuccinate synthase
MAIVVNENFSGSRGLMEGSQGALLSLNHGHYPYCTGKDVTVPAICAEMGLSHHRINQVWGVVRLIPMRVPGPSGPTAAPELSYDDVEETVQIRIPKHKRMQGDATASTEERLFEFSMDELVKSHYLNGFTHLAITFADYHRPGNYRQTEWDGLHDDTKLLIGDIERELQIPVVLVRTGQGEHDNIWRGEVE